MKVGDLIYHRDDPTMQRGHGLVLKVYLRNKGNYIDVYWSDNQHVVCSYMPDELRLINESR